ncbi:hypothetical protein L204_102898 [Cryptococcus depauperatus]|nr:hypothetical protein L204_00357 [Cryptococcus depauperatus CBS 7855]
MEKYSKWRDPATGIQPFLPPIAPRSGSTLFAAALAPLCLLHVAVRAILLAIIGLVHVVLVDVVCLVFLPVPLIYTTVNGWLTAITCRLALVLMGYWWITTELVSPRRGKAGVAQVSERAPRKGDLILANWTGYVELLFLAFRHNPTFLLPIFGNDVSQETQKTGRHTGTGSANIGSVLIQPRLIGYKPYSLGSLLMRTGALPDQCDIPQNDLYKTLREARRKENRPIVLFPESTTSNGRAILRFGEGVLAEGDVGVGDGGIIWIKFFKHSSPTAFSPSATCPLPKPLKHLLLSQLYTPTLWPHRSLHIRTLHPAASPSSPSFLPGEILNTQPGGLDAAGKDHRNVWREACAVTLAETGRVRRVKGMGWLEKKAFLEYWTRGGQR